MANDLCDNCEKSIATYRDKKPYSHGIIRQRCKKCLLNDTMYPNNFEPIKKETMLNKLTPSDFEVLLRYCRNKDSSLFSFSVENLVKLNFLEEIENGNSMTMDGYKITKGGRMLVEALCSTPLPVQKWVMPEKS